MKFLRFLPLLVLVLATGALVTPAAHSTEVAEPQGAPVGAETCFECHESAQMNLANVHMRIGSFEVQGRTVGCAGCHGDGARHAEEADPEFIRSFSDEGTEASEVCMECHQTKHLMEWSVSTHAVEGVGCDSCHSIHSEVPQADTCQGCHAEEVAKFWLPSRHPVREGKMDCDSCHDPHASTEGLLKTRQRSNDLCFTCHQNHEGPFIFEHSPVEEDCAICHDPHGAVAPSLLTVGEPMVCLQCHDFHFHAGYKASDDHEVDVGGTERGNPFGNDGMNIAFTTNCTQCHDRIHGSDLPSQGTPGQGKGLVR